MKLGIYRKRDSSEVVEVVKSLYGVTVICIREDGSMDHVGWDEFKCDYYYMGLNELRSGDWVECICNNTAYGSFVVGEKYQVSQGHSLDIYINFKEGNNKSCTLFEEIQSSFKPCMPPKVTVTKLDGGEWNIVGSLEKTYTNAEIMQMMDDGEFEEGDLIEDAQGTVCEYTIYEDGDLYFDHIDKTKYVVFTKGGVWTIKRKTRWIRCTAEEALTHYAESTEDVKVIVNRQETTIENTGNEDSYFTATSEQIAYGIWYKKVKTD